MKTKTFKPYPESKLLTPEDYIKYDREEMWRTMTGETILIKNLRNSHLANIIIHFREHGREAPDVIKQEIKRRKQARLTKLGKAGKVLYGNKKGTSLG